MTNKPIALIRASLSFGAVDVLRNVSLAVTKGEFVAIVGPSGCGKTTLLSLMAGHLTPSSGTVERSGVVRTIYQQDGLFPWLTVSENITMGLRESTQPKARAAELSDLIRLIRLEGFEDHYPHHLSGGMKQRVELARALAGNSDTLLMDEPFSALDYQTRLRMRRELVRLLTLRPRTVMFVTHDIEEAAQLADRILVLSDRPAHVRFEMALSAPKPRDLAHPEVLEAIETLTRELGLDEIESVNSPPERESSLDVSAAT